MPLFHNPYHFVPLGPGGPPESVPLRDFTAAQDQRQAPHLTHDRFVPGTHSGRIVCRVTVETPLICGNGQESNEQGQPRDGWTKRIKQFELEPGVPSLPGSAIRGMLSSLAEAASNSAMRVLNSQVLSYRRLTSDERKLSALGIIEAGPNGELRLRPLALPAMQLDDERCYRFFSTPANGSFVGDDQRFPGVFPEPSFKVYLGHRPYTADQYRDTTGRPLKNIALSVGGGIGPFYGMKLALQSPAWASENGIVNCGQPWQRYPTRKNQQGQRVPNPTFLIGRKAVEPAQVTPWEDGMENQGFTRGIFRGLGLWMSDRKSACPTSKYHELFIPFTKVMEQWPTLPILPTAIERFNQLSEQRTEEDPKRLLPFEPIGTRPNRNGAPLDLRPGDVVYFLPNKGGSAIEEISFSSMWRGRVEERDENMGDAASSDIRRFVGETSPEFVPLSPGRTVLTLAEQLFGAVEVRNRKQQKDLKDKPAFALASRLRVSHALLRSAPASGPYQPASELWTREQQQTVDQRIVSNIPLKNLASPKPPCPSLYFRTRDGASAYITKKALNPASHAPHGRKFYLRRKDPSAVRGDQVFVHPDRFNDPDERDSIGRQHQSIEKFVRPGGVFFFHLDFDNVSDLELQLLVYALQPTANFRHQLGHGKPLGLGQIRIETVGLMEINRIERYQGSLLSPKYHDAYVADTPETDWPAPLTRGLPEVAARKAIATQLDELAANFKKWASAKGLSPVLAAVELIGDPTSVCHPIHYPQRADAPAGSAEFERELYKWFVDNDDAFHGRRPGQFLAPLVNADGQVAAEIPALNRQQTEAPPRTNYLGPKQYGASRRVPYTPQAIQPRDLIGQRVENCVVEAHETKKKKLAIRFKIPSSPIPGFLENPMAIPNVTIRYRIGWCGPMKVQNLQKTNAGSQFTLRPVE